MRRIFADTHYWIALIHKEDEHHDLAKTMPEQLAPLRIVTTHMVLAEFLNSFGNQQRAYYKRPAARLVDAILSDPETIVVDQTASQFDRALDIYKTYRDKEWGLTDCASYNVMNDEGIADALTHDHHFEQMGFTALMRNSH